MSYICLRRDNNLLTSVRCYDRKLIYVVRFEVQHSCDTDFATTRPNLEILHFAETITQGVIDHRVDPTVRICCRHLKQKTRHISNKRTLYDS
jgi:hypothetical protein